VRAAEPKRGVREDSLRLTYLCAAGLRRIRTLGESAARQRGMSALNCSHYKQVSAAYRTTRLYSMQESNESDGQFNLRSSEKKNRTHLLLKIQMVISVRIGASLLQYDVPPGCRPVLNR